MKVQMNVRMFCENFTENTHKYTWRCLLFITSRNFFEKKEHSQDLWAVTMTEAEKTWKKKNKILQINEHLK